MNSKVNTIRQRLSLREPLAQALDLTSRLCDSLSLKKPPTDQTELKSFLTAELGKVKAVVQSVKSFERDFPSLAFSIATGIGKTRLMGAIIAYLYKAKGIKHFFILAPNLTLYKKLIRDFGDTSYSKYVFKGMSEFSTSPPQVVTGETYNDRTMPMFSSLQINIFNISKFNKDSKEGKKGVPKMRRLSEYIGQSYFDYLAGLPDLVILMDEAHRYHANAAKKAVNELRPILGCEMTATPMDEKGNAFKNIVYEYNLAQALADKRYVKDPTVASRKNFNRKNLSDEEIEVIKLEDGISVHEKTKLAIELYAKQHGRPIVHPFILVACKNIEHAKSVTALLESDRIYHGRYKDKVLRIDSETKKDDEIEQQFVALESPDNKIEIVVHVNMLKEGWDVNNLYTIIPLRAADAAILIEQTIGRGLRLPYGGERTGVKDVDTLTVIAHDNFAEVIKKAQDPSSVLSKLSYIELDDDDVLHSGSETVVTTTPGPVQKYVEAVKQAKSDSEKKSAQQTYDAVSAVLDAIPKVAETTASYRDLKNPEVIAEIRRVAVGIIKERTKAANPLFAEQEASEQISQVGNVINSVLIDYERNAIEIPRLVVEQPHIRKVFDDFELDTTNGYNLSDANYEIVRQSLATGAVDVIEGRTGTSKGRPVYILVSRLIDFDDVDYDDNSDLLYKLSGQAVEAIRKNSEKTADNEIAEKVFVFREQLGQNIYRQMNEHAHVVKENIRPSKVLPFTKLRDQHIIDNGFGKRLVSDIPENASMARKYIVTGFKKSYYPDYRFDSGTEWDFAFVLENSPEVLKWIRPVPEQFNIYWDNGSKRYEPDFIVETGDAIYMCETKAEKDMESEEVKGKAEAAINYCTIVSEFTAAHGGKPWKYVIIPHTVVVRTSSFNHINASSQLWKS